MRSSELQVQNKIAAPRCADRKRHEDEIGNRNDFSPILSSKFESVKEEIMERIIISKHHVQENKNELVRLRKEAQQAVYRMQRESGLSASFIVSEIVRQAENFVEFTEDGDVQVC